MSRRPGYDIYGQPTRIDPRDYPDPLDATEFETFIRDSGFQAEAEAALADHRRLNPPHYTRDGCGPAVLLLLCLAALVAAPRNAPVQSAQSGAPLAAEEWRWDREASVLPRRAEQAPFDGMAGVEPARVGGGGAPTPATAAAVTYSGTASWFAASGDQGAVPWWQPGQDPVWASVCAFEEHTACVTVLITGWCACLQGQPGQRLIDLSEHAFAQLAPLSAGLIRVTMEVGTAGPGLPATDQ